MINVEGLLMVTCDNNPTVFPRLDRLLVLLEKDRHDGLIRIGRHAGLIEVTLYLPGCRT